MELIGEAKNPQKKQGGKAEEAQGRKGEWPSWLIFSMLNGVERRGL
jgi:hypothetical protein